MTHDIDIDNRQLWFLLPGGTHAIARKPLSAIPDGMRVATMGEMIHANAGYPFHVGFTPEDKPPKLYNKGIGVGGLYHGKWFITQQGRVGGAANVPKKGVGAMRTCFHTHGGLPPNGNPVLEREGYAIVKEVAQENVALYNKIWKHVGKHVTADSGYVQISPLDDSNHAFVTYCGRCMECPNIKDYSIEALREHVPQYVLELTDEQKDWGVDSIHDPVQISVLNKEN